MLVAGTLKADFVTSQVTCSVLDQSLTASDFCSVAGDFGSSASASVSASFALPTSPGPLSLASIEQGFAKGHWNGDATNRSAFFSDSLSILLTLDTPGDPRPGFFRITGGTSVICCSFDASFAGSIFGFDTRTLPISLHPIALGEPFTFTYTRSMSCYDHQLILVCLGNNVALSHYDLHLYEADGVTPVLITLATPEPSSATLLLLSLSCLLLAGWRQVKSEWLVSARPAPSSAPTTQG